MKSSNKERLLRIPVLGSVALLVHAVFTLPRRNRDTSASLVEVETQLSQITEDHKASYKDVSDRLSALVKSNDNLSQQLAFINVSETDKKVRANTANSDKVLFAEDHLSDVFYANFEDKFRGTEVEIRRRISKDYLPLFKKSGIDYKKFPILDIGSGRGEFLSLMNDSGLTARGIDINTDMVKRSKKKGLDAVEGDATTYLNTALPQSFGAVTGFHIVEHIPFNQLLRLFTAAHTALTEGGFVLFETPNPENIIVGSYSFYLDPSHLNPVPPDLLAFALENCGFRNIEIRRLHPSEDHIADSKKIPADLAERLYGPRDYCVIAYK